MIAYKLFRLKKNGDITPLFINRKLVLETGIWYEAEAHPTKGYALHPGWHTALDIAPHLSTKGRVWKKVEIEDYYEFKRPNSQGGVWLIAKRLKVLED